MQQTFHLHGVGKIRHMLMMGWGGEPIDEAAYEQGAYKKYLNKALTPIRDLGVLHGDLSAGHILWNEELNRLMLIDFNRCRLSLPDPVEWKPKWLTEWDSLAKEEKDHHRQHYQYDASLDYNHPRASDRPIPLVPIGATTNPKNAIDISTSPIHPTSRLTMFQPSR
ncbi:hypothetical protein M747DRAFT_306435 [Aspergillus niger ATCC 13496]|uniref:Uncharacterized protein n=1 Tax=Aspergillus niger ATCC 13496 TaxID=1353008 RepID=A0A370C0T6_ASPNG|nr:hypothetical protein M747DRAFT_306435 [Aspergillus niger ATCC 13496]